MALQYLAFLSLVCSIFGTTSEPTYHGRNLISRDVYKPKEQTNPTLTLYTDEHRRPNEMRHYNMNIRSKRETNDDPCEPFTFRPGKKRLTHPKTPEDSSKPGESTYTKNTTCLTTIQAPDNGQVITLTFVDVFHIEGHPQCKNDYLEIRDGKYGYATPVYTFCGHSFPPTITSTGQFLWLKFHSDDIIEYSGFVIDIEFPAKATIKTIHESCYRRVTRQKTGVIDSNSEDVKQCREQSPGALDIQWRIETAYGTQIYLSITKFQLADPNNCSANSVQVFGAEPNYDHNLQVYCSSVAPSLITKPESKGFGPGNIMYIRMYTERRLSNFSANFTEFRTADSCDDEEEFDCLDGTCIHINLKCDRSPNCRLNTDEDPVDCKGETRSLVTENRTILIVFSLILSGIIFVLLFKCVRKAYQDQKQINANRAKISSLLAVDKASQITFNRKPGKDFDPCSLESENRANEIYRQNIQRQSSSSGSDFLQPEAEDWAEAVPILPGDIRIEHKAKPARDFSLREELLRAKVKEEKETREESTAAHEAECQTRESLLLTDPIPKPGSKSRSTSRVVSGAGGPAPVEPPGLLRQATAPDTSQKGRPTSSETTRSAPDVVIVSPNN